MSNNKQMPTGDDYWARNPARQALAAAGYMGTAELFATLSLPRDFWRSDKVEKETGVSPVRVPGIANGLKMWPPGTAEKLHKAISCDETAQRRLRWNSSQDRIEAACDQCNSFGGRDGRCSSGVVAGYPFRGKGSCRFFSAEVKRDVINERVVRLELLVSRLYAELGMDERD